MMRLLALCLVLLCAPSFAKEAAPMAADEVIEKRLLVISEELRCLVCQNESLAGSRADLAQDLRREIRDLIKQGKSDQEILDFMVARYGDFVRYRPPVKATTWALWLGPFLLLIGGVAALVKFLLARRREQAAPSLTADERKRAAELLKKAESDHS